MLQSARENQGAGRIESARRSVRLADENAFPRWLHPPRRRRRPGRVAVLGSTGSIGQNTLAVLEHARCSVERGDAADGMPVSGGRYCLFGISGHSNVQQLAADASKYSPQQVVCSDESQADQWRSLCPAFGGKFKRGREALVELAADPEVDVAVAAIVGRAGLESTLAAIQAGKIVALANKETMVMAGHLATRLALEADARILPVDSEHNAIFQCLQASGPKQIRRIVLTASGGPFRNGTPAELENATPAQALAHPNWKMGDKISIDSATMVNKALEIIEAKWLFGLEADQIQVVVHPESVVHSMVEFVDGTILAQMSPPDMKLPIQYALDFPERYDSPARKMDFSTMFRLNFEPPDMDRFPALLVGLEVAKRGGTCGVVLNAANEVAVQAFLDGKIRFTQIVPVCQRVLKHHHYEEFPELEAILEMDRWARQETNKCISN